MLIISSTGASISAWEKKTTGWSLDAIHILFHFYFISPFSFFLFNSGTSYKIQISILLAIYDKKFGRNDMIKIIKILNYVAFKRKQNQQKTHIIIL